MQYPLTSAGRKVPALVLDRNYKDGIPCSKLRIVSESEARKLGYPVSLRVGKEVYAAALWAFKVKL